jgi:hypothetical protein
MVRNTPEEHRSQFPGDPWVHFCNGFFEVYIFLIKRVMFFLNNCRTSSISGVFILFDG